MAMLLGWKDILRPIRDGYHHLFPAPDTGPTPEERRKQRESDRLKGFTYFDTFDQLQEWTENDSDPLQRANTTLLRRCPAQVEDGQAKADVVLIHDHAGNYHLYEAVQRTSVDAELYTCEYLQHVDTFIYFSHKLICVPPATWTNVLHRNGVISLGTLLIEPQTEDSERLLQRTGDHLKWKFPMAKKLADIAQHYGFDGWLINIEKPFPKAEWDPDVMSIFLETLRTEMGQCKKLIWYDALTIYNKVSYQNALNRNNAPFAKECEGTLLNYCWNDVDAEASVEFAPRIDLSLKDTAFGIDVWAQNTTKLTHPRVTYPKKGGGGTNTGVAVAKLAGLGLSAGVFAPAWSFEHFPSHGRAVERAIWEGTELPEDLECSCGNCKMRHQVNADYPIIKSSRERAAGSERFFYTDFTRAFRKHSGQEKDVLYAQLGAQSILPRPPTLKNGDDAVYLSYLLEDMVRGTQLVVIQNSSSSEQFEQQLPLYKLDMSTAQPLHFQTQCRNMASSKLDLVVNFYLKSTSGTQFVPVPKDDRSRSVKASIDIGMQEMSNIRLQELGVHVRGAVAPDKNAQRVLEISDICIAPMPARRATQYTIHDIRVEHRGEEENAHMRLCWFYSVGPNFEKVDGLPYSDITGPFSYFKVCIDGIEIGRAYALEHPLIQDPTEDGKQRSVEIVGFGFDGRLLAESKVVLSM